MILSASMGGGHDGVAEEMARRLGALGFETVRVDFLALLPWRLGPALRRFYEGLLDHLPAGYELIYRTFFFSSGERHEKVSPVVRAALPSLRRVVERVRPDVVVSTYHLAARAAGELVLSGQVDVPAITFVTDFAAHDLWLHPGSSLFLCVDQGSAKRATERTGARAVVTGPVVRSDFGRRAQAGRQAKRAELGIPADARVALVVAGSWTVGDVAGTTRLLASSGRFVPVAVCGHDRALRARLSATGGVALGWVEDMAGLMAASDVLVENAGGLTAAEAMSAGVPVVTYRPIPGHGRDNAERMHRAGVSVLARDHADLLGRLDQLCRPGDPLRDRLVAAGTALFRQDAASVVASAVPAVPGTDRSPALDSLGPESVQSGPESVQSGPESVPNGAVAAPAMTPAVVGRGSPSADRGWYRPQRLD